MRSASNEAGVGLSNASADASELRFEGEWVGLAMSAVEAIGSLILSIDNCGFALCNSWSLASTSEGLRLAMAKSDPPMD